MPHVNGHRLCMEEPPIDREDVLVIMRSLLRIHLKLDTILVLLGGDDEEEEAEEES